MKLKTKKDKQEKPETLIGTLIESTKQTLKEMWVSLNVTGNIGKYKKLNKNQQQEIRQRWKSAIISECIVMLIAFWLYSIIFFAMMTLSFMLLFFAIVLIQRTIGSFSEVLHEYLEENSTEV